MGPDPGRIGGEPDRLGIVQPVLNGGLTDVATAAYNWCDCGEGTGLWQSLASRAREPFAFAKPHGKQYVLAEFASQRDPRRAQWIRDAYAWLKQNRASIRGASTTTRQPPGPAATDA